MLFDCDYKCAVPSNRHKPRLDGLKLYLKGGVISLFFKLDNTLLLGN